jgi:hypothetical protein
MENENNFIKIKGTDFYLSKDDENYKKVFEKWGKGFDIEAIGGKRGLKIDLSKLNNNESVCWGDGKNYYFKLTKI